MTGQGAVTREAGTGLPRFARNDEFVISGF